MERYDYIVIGGGLGGYPAAIDLARRGSKVAIIEMRRFGGECANYGCIPTKALLHAAHVVHESNRIPGLTGELASYGDLKKWRDSITKKLSGGVEWLLKSYGVDIYRGRGRLEGGDGKVVIESNGSTKTLEADKILIATGSIPAYPPGVVVDHKRILDNRSILELQELPRSMIIVGGGPIGVEYATALAALGTKVTLIEMLPTILYGMDEDAVKVLVNSMKRMGIKLMLSSPLESIEVRGDKVHARVKGGEEVEAEYALIATGRKPATKDLGLEDAGVETDRKGFIAVDNHMRTSNPRIYAAGDVTGPPFLAHRAYAQSLVAAANMAGENVEFKGYMPLVVYSIPQVAGVGVTEAEAKEKGINYGVAVFKYAALGRAFVESNGEGLIKIVYDKETKKVLGVHAAGPASEGIISEATVALELGATLEDMARIIRPHPTMHEALREVAELALGKPVHVYVKK